ncbi:MAG: hypothetical protein U0325_35850 [Polyangiales bacterium]
MATDAAGNVYVVVLSAGDDGAVDDAAPRGGSDALVVSLSPAGVVRWAARLGGGEDDDALAVTVDATGNVYAVGNLRARADLGTLSATSRGDTDAWVASFTSEGTPRWFRAIGGDGADEGHAVAPTPGGGVVVTGHVRGAVDFGRGATTGGSGIDLFVASLNEDGTLRWAQRFGGTTVRPGGASGHGLAAAPDGTVVVSGLMSGTLDFGGDLLVSAGSYDAFVLSMTSTGSHRWSRRFGAAATDWSLAATVDAMGNAYITGFFQGGVDFGGGVLSGGTASDAFLASYTPAGTHRWSRRYGGTTTVFGSASGQGLAFDASGNLAVGGLFSGTVDFGGGTRGSAGNADAFLMSVTPAGVHRWSRRFGAADADEVRAVAADAAGNIDAVGAFEGIVDFGGGAITSSGLSDGFALQFAQ